MSESVTVLFGLLAMAALAIYVFAKTCKGETKKKGDDKNDY